MIEKLCVVLGVTLLLLAVVPQDCLAEKEPTWAHETEYRVMAVDISEDGKYIAAGMNDGSGTNDRLMLFEKGSSTPLWETENTSGFSAISVSADGAYIAAAQGSTVQLYHRDNRTPLWEFTEGDGIRSVAISADGKYIVAGSNEKVYYFDRTKATPLWKQNSKYTSRVSISANGSRVFIAMGGGNYKEMIRYFSGDGTVLWEKEGGPTSLGLSADGLALGVAWGGNRITIYNHTYGQVLWEYSRTDGTGAMYMAISADGKYVGAVSGGNNDDAAFLRFTIDNRTPLWKTVITKKISDFAMSADGKAFTGTNVQGDIFLVDMDGTVLWNTSIESWINSIAMPGNSATIVAGNNGNKVYYFSGPKNAGGGDGNGGDDNGSPGFEILIIAPAMGTSVLLHGNRRRRRNI